MTDIESRLRDLMRDATLAPPRPIAYATVRSLDVGACCDQHLRDGNGGSGHCFRDCGRISAPQTTAPDIATPADASITTASATADWPDTRSSVSYPESGVTLEPLKSVPTGLSEESSALKVALAPSAEATVGSVDGQLLGFTNRYANGHPSPGTPAWVFRWALKDGVNTAIIGKHDPAGEIRPALRKSCTYVSVVDAINTRVLESFASCPSRLEADSISSGKS